MDEETRELERYDSDTETEAEEVERGEMDSEEAHRYGEFRELRGLMDDVLREIRGLRDEFSRRYDMAAAAVEDGAVVREFGDDVPDAVEVDTDGNVEEIVYDLDDLDLTL